MGQDSNPMQYLSGYNRSRSKLFFLPGKKFILLLSFSLEGIVFYTVKIMEADVKPTSSITNVALNQLLTLFLPFYLMRSATLLQHVGQCVPLMAHLRQELPQLKLHLLSENTRLIFCTTQRSTFHPALLMPAVPSGLFCAIVIGASLTKQYVPVSTPRNTELYSYLSHNQAAPETLCCNFKY